MLLFKLAIDSLTKEGALEMNTLRITFAIFMLAGLATASVEYQPIDTTDFVNRAATYQGQLVAVTGEVCAVNADGKSVRLFDANSKALIDVSISHLQRSQRRALMLRPVHRVSVYGKAQVQNGKLSIDAHRVVVQPNLAAVSAEADEGQ
jgi:hypothetical protein